MSAAKVVRRNDQDFFLAGYASTASGVEGQQKRKLSSEFGLVVSILIVKYPKLALLDTIPSIRFVGSYKLQCTSTEPEVGL